MTSGHRTAPPITLCGSLSQHPVQTGARMHNAGYRALGLPFAYVPFAIGPEHLADALVGARALGIRGLGISMPFKVQILPLLDDVDDIAARIGAVNTVVNDDGRWSGHNTDWWGAVAALEESLGAGALNKSSAIVIGAGGAARAVAFGLRQAGARLTIVNRTVERAHALAQELDIQWAGLDALEDLTNTTIVVNASSAGMASQSAARCVPREALHDALTVMEVVYDPVNTVLVQEARAAGARVIDGRRMLLHQAARQFELYTRRRAPLAAMEQSLLDSRQGD